MTGTGRRKSLTASFPKPVSKRTCRSRAATEPVIARAADQPVVAVAAVRVSADRRDQPVVAGDPAEVIRRRLLPVRVSFRSEPTRSRNW